MPNTRRDDDRVRMLTIPHGWPARTVARLLEAAAEETVGAAEDLNGAACDASNPYDRRRKSAAATAVVEGRSDGIAVYAPRDLKEARP